LMSIGKVLAAKRTEDTVPARIAMLPTAMTRR
jgi:hypothetical protein